MPRSEEAAAFFHAVYEAIQEIPPGRVTTYGHIAMLIGTRKIHAPHACLACVTDTLGLQRNALDKSACA